MTSNEKKLKPELELNQKCSTYQDISLEVQTRLIEMVQQNGLSVYQAANILRLKNSAAKNILRRHRNTRLASKKPAKTHNSLQSASKMPQKANQNSQITQPIIDDQKCTLQNTQTVNSQLVRPQYYPFLNYFFDPLTLFNLWNGPVDQPHSY